MLTPEQAFSKYCRKHRFKRLGVVPAGILMVLQAQKRPVATQIHYFQKSLFIPTKPLEIYFGYLDYGGLDAFADFEAPYGFVGMYRGSILLLKDMFQRMLSHPMVLPWIGNAAAEVLDGGLADGLSENIDDVQRARKMRGVNPYPPIPKDPVRQAFSRVVSQFALDFLSIHELAHLSLGHCEYLKGNRRLPLRTARALATTLTEAQSTFLQAMEMGADNAAAGFTMRLLFRKAALTPEVQSFFSTIEQKLFVWSFAIAGLFRLWKIEQLDIKAARFGDHPPVAMRFAMAFNTAKLVLQQLNLGAASVFDSVSQSAINSFELGVRAIGGKRLSQKTLVSIFEAKSQAHFRKIRAYMYGRLNPALAPYSHVAFPPPSPMPPKIIIAKKVKARKIKASSP
jgi:hypothetical protein